MWGALRTDLKEFVSTVTEDTSNALSKLDDQLDRVDDDHEDDDDHDNDHDHDNEKATAEEAEKEAARRRRLEETYAAPLIRPDENENEDDDDDPAVREFVSTFVLDEDEKRRHLELYGGTLQPFLDKFVVAGGTGTDDEQQHQEVGAVSERDFWMRYFYRCSADRIADEWRRQDEEEEEKAGGGVAGSLLGVRSLLGGAVHQAAAAVTDVTKSTSAAAASAAGGGASFFDTKGRPPFVMNTAVSEDDDDEEEEEEEEDEEELGWDDDDDDDDFGEDEEEGGEYDEKMEEIEFQDTATAQLQEQYQLAIEERDQLHQTVAMQAKQLADLMQKEEKRKEGNKGGNESTTAEEVESLKMQLFEKESELGAVKARLADSPRAPSKVAPPSDEEGNNNLAQHYAARIEELEREMKVAVGSLESKESELSTLRSEYETAKEEWEASATSAAAAAAAVEQQGDDDEGERRRQALEARVRELEGSVNILKVEKQAMDAKCSQLEQTVASLEADKESLRQKLEQAESTRQQEIELIRVQFENVQSKLSSSEAQVGTLKGDIEAANSAKSSQQQELESVTAELQDAESKLSESEGQVAQLKEELQASAKALQEQKEEALAAAAAAAAQEQNEEGLSHDTTVSSGVKVEAPPTVPDDLATGEDEDDWGDDW